MRRVVCACLVVLLCAFSGCGDDGSTTSANDSAVDPELSDTGEGSAQPSANGDAAQSNADGDAAQSNADGDAAQSNADEDPDLPTTDGTVTLVLRFRPNATPEEVYAFAKSVGSPRYPFSLSVDYEAATISVHSNEEPAPAVVAAFIEEAEASPLVVEVVRSP